MTAFRTIELSEPEFEVEGIRLVTVKSPALRHRGDVTVYRSEGVSAESGVLILLHGVYGSHWAWTMKGGVHRTATRLVRAGKIRPLVIAMPSDGLWGDGSAYAAHSGSDFERWILDDVPACARLAVTELGPTGSVGIGGLSMGGFGAMRIGCKHPDRFVAISAHSSAIAVRQLEPWVEEPLASYDPSIDETVLHWALENKQRLPRFRFDCGDEDPLLSGNRELHAELEANGVAHEYVEFSGGHSWDYWREHVEDTLLFFDAALRAK
jgi:putative tributyrin esterase